MCNICNYATSQPYNQIRFIRITHTMINFLLQDFNWALLLMATIAGLLLSRPLWAGATAGASAIGTAEAVRLINREKGVLIDVNEADEYAKSHAVGSKNIPCSQFKTEAAPSGLPGNKAWPIILICERGSRSAKMVAKVRQAGYTHVYTVTGGLTAWRDAQLPLESATTSGVA